MPSSAVEPLAELVAVHRGLSWSRPRTANSSTPLVRRLIGSSSVDPCVGCIESIHLVRWVVTIRTTPGVRNSTRSTACRAAPADLRSVAMWSQRSVIDYSLQRRATLAALFRGTATATDVCDADPYLLRAAKHHGRPTDAAAARSAAGTGLTELCYVYGDELGPFQGRIRAPAGAGDDGPGARRVPGVRRGGVPRLLVEPPDHVVPARRRCGSDDRCGPGEATRCRE